MINLLHLSLKLNPQGILSHLGNKLLPSLINILFRMTLFKPQVKSVPKQPTGSKPHPPIIKETSRYKTFVTDNVIFTIYNF